MATTNSSKMESIPLIKFSSNDGFIFTEEGNNFLNNLPEDMPIALISIVGKYRTGKSYFVNRVLLNDRKIFKVGPTINACTKVKILLI